MEKIYWLLGSKSQSSAENKLLYKAILFGSYGIRLWSPIMVYGDYGPISNIEILQRFQNKYLRIIVNAL